MARKIAMVVEDTAELLASISATLQDLGYDVLEARDGTDALEQLRSGKPPDVIITDLVMPLMSGWEFIARVRDFPALRLVPVVATSAFGVGRNSAKWFEAFLPKPFTTEDLEQAIRMALAARSGAVA